MGDHVIGWPLAMFKCYINHLSKECQRRQKKSALCKHLRTSLASSSVFMIDLKKRLQRRLWSRQQYKQFYLNNNIIALFLLVCLLGYFLGIFYRDTHVFLVIFPTRDSNPARGNAVHEKDFIKMWRIWGMQFYHPHASNTRLRFVIRFLCV